MNYEIKFIKMPFWDIAFCNTATNRIYIDEKFKKEKDIVKFLINHEKEHLKSKKFTFNDIRNEFRNSKIIFKIIKKKPLCILAPLFFCHYEPFEKRFYIDYFYFFCCILIFLISVVL